MKPAESLHASEREIDAAYPPFTLNDAFSAAEIASDPFSSGLGRVVEAFAVLEERVSAAIANLLGVSPGLGALVTANMSFGDKLRLMASLVRHVAPSRQFNAGCFAQLDVLDAIVRTCTTCEELRDGAIRSAWRHTESVPSAEPRFTAAQLAGIGDYIVWAGECVVDYLREMDDGE